MSTKQSKRGRKKAEDDEVEIIDDVPPPSKKSRSTKKKSEDSEAPAAADKKKSRSKKVEKVSPNKDEGSSKGKSAFHLLLSRKPPQAVGSRKFPIGKPGCFEGKNFVVTGVLECFKRDTVEDEIRKYGGNILKSFTKKTNYLVAGRDAGPAKLRNAEEWGVTKLSEDEFLDMLAATNPKANAKEADSTTNGGGSSDKKAPQTKKYESDGDSDTDYDDDDDD